MEKRFQNKKALVPAEVEGGELLVSKNGSIVKRFQGKSHEKGGIKTALPQDHFVISKYDLDKDGIGDSKAWNKKSEIEKAAYLKALENRKEGTKEVEVEKYLNGGNILGNSSGSGAGFTSNKFNLGNLDVPSLLSSAANIGTSIATGVQSEKDRKKLLEEDEAAFKQRMSDLYSSTVYKNLVNNNLNTNPYIYSKNGGKVEKEYKLGGTSTGYKTASGVLGTAATIASAFGPIGMAVGAGLGLASLGTGIAGNVREREEGEEAQALSDERIRQQEELITKNTNERNNIQKQIAFNPYLISKYGSSVKKYADGDPVEEDPFRKAHYLSPEYKESPENPPLNKVETKPVTNPETPNLGVSLEYNPLLHTNLNKDGSLPKAYFSEVSEPLKSNETDMYAKYNPYKAFLTQGAIGSVGRELQGYMQALAPNTPAYRPPHLAPPVLQQDFTEAQRKIANDNAMAAFNLNRAYTQPSSNSVTQAQLNTAAWNDLMKQQQAINAQVAQDKMQVNAANTALQNQNVDQLNAANLEASKMNFIRGVEADNLRSAMANKTIQEAQQYREDVDRLKAANYLSSVRDSENLELSNLQREYQILANNTQIPEAELQELLKEKSEEIRQAQIKQQLQNQNLYNNFNPFKKRV